MTRVTLPFDPTYVRPVQDGEKTLSLRYDLDDELEAGVPIDMITDDSGQLFARAICLYVARAPAEDFAGVDLPGHRSYADTDELLAHLGQYYPDDELTPTTELAAVLWTRAVHAPSSWELQGGEQA